MIHYLKIRNFGTIKNEVEINFEVAENQEENAYEVKMPDGRRLLKLAYIYGANASGKTTVLKAFDFLRSILTQPASNKSKSLPYDPFLFCDNALAQDSSFELSFYYHEIRHVYSFRFDKQSVREEKLLFYQTSRPSELFTRETENEKRLTKIQFGSRIKVPARERDLLESNTLHNNTVLGAYARTNVDIPELEALSRWLGGYLMGMITSGDDLTEITAGIIDDQPEIREWVNTLLNKADEQIVDMDIEEKEQYSNKFKEFLITSSFSNSVSTFAEEENSFEKTTIKRLFNPEKMTNNRQTVRELFGRRIEFVHMLENEWSFLLSFEKESSGTRRYFGLGGLLYLLVHGNHLLCIDELETSLHPDLMKHFLQVFLMNSNSSQLLFTTHNLSMMADEDFIRRDALWFTEKESDGSVSLYSAADFDSSTLRKDASLIKAYKAGKLGAKPNLGSPLIAK